MIGFMKSEWTITKKKASDKQLVSSNQYVDEAKKQGLIDSKTKP
jgi:hypothetical protein